jgi:hypothetical protein
MTNIPLAWTFQTPEDVGVEHNGLPAGAWNPNQKQASKHFASLNTFPKLGFQAKAGDLLHERQACWLDYTTGTKW